MTPDILTALDALEREWRETGERQRSGASITFEILAGACLRHADQLAAVRASYADRTDEIATLRARVKNLERLLSVD